MTHQYSNILFLAGTLGQGGAEKQLYYIVKSLAVSGRQVTVATLGSGEYWENPIAALGVPVVQIKTRGRLSRMKALYQLMRQTKPNLVFCLHFYATLYAALPARLLGIRSAGSIRSNGFHELENIGRRMGWCCYHAPNLIVANSSHGAANLQNLYGGRRNSLRVLNNVIDTEIFSCEERPVPDTLILILVARLVPLKRADMFLRLLQALVQAGQPCRGVIVGYGPEEEKLKKLASEMPNPQAVEFAGTQSNVLPWLQKAHIMVSTSSHEGVSNVFLEAMATCLPLLVMRFDGVETLVEHEKQGMVANDEAELLLYARTLLANESLRKKLGEAGRQKVEKEFSLDGLAERFVAAVQ